MIYKTFKIAEDNSSNCAWEIEVRLYSDGLGISTGLSDFALVDYVDTDRLVEVLENTEKGKYVVECSIGDNLLVEVHSTTTVLCIREDIPLAIIPNPFKKELISILRQI